MDWDFSWIWIFREPRPDWPPVTNDVIRDQYRPAPADKPPRGA